MSIVSMRFLFVFVAALVALSSAAMDEMEEEGVEQNEAEMAGVDEMEDQGVEMSEAEAACHAEMDIIMSNPDKYEAYMNGVMKLTGDNGDENSHLGEHESLYRDAGLSEACIKLTVSS